MAANRVKRFLVALESASCTQLGTHVAQATVAEHPLLDLMRGTEGVLNGLLGEYPGTFRHYADALALYDR